MGRLFLIIGLSVFCSITGFSQSSQHKRLSDCPIQRGTNKITYSHHTNSGMARYTSIQLFPDSLVWNYTEARNGCSLRDVSRYDRKDFEEMVSRLSEISFAAQDTHDYRLGGSGYGYSFENEKGSYLAFNRTFKFSGNYQEVYSIIQGFIRSHKTECEKLFEQYSHMPHERAQFGEFKILPKQLEKYKAK